MLFFDNIGGIGDPYVYGDSDGNIGNNIGGHNCILFVFSTCDG